MTAMDVSPAHSDWVGEEDWYLPDMNVALVPSGSAHRPPPPARDDAPSGASRWFIPQLLPLGLPLGFVMLSSVGQVDSSTTRVPGNLERSAVFAPSLLPARRPRDEEEEPAEQRAVSLVVSTEVAHQAADGVAESGALSITAEDQVSGIQDALSLSVTQMAEIVGVTRATIYAWIRGDVPVPRDAGKTQRLRELHRLATAWRARCSEHLGRLVTARLGDDDPSLLELLKAPEWDHPAIDQTMRVLSGRLEGRALEQRQAQSRGLEPARPVTPENIEQERLHLRGLA